MPLFFNYTDCHIHLAVWKIEESEEEMLAQMSSCCRESMLHFSAKSRRLEWLSVRLLLKTMLGRYTEISYYSWGKPYLADSSNRISISHTRGYSAVILGKEQDLGVDIEYADARVGRIMKTFISEEEVAFIDKVNPVPQALICWCAKETLFKMISGEHGTIDFKIHLHISPFIPQESGKIEAYETYTTDTATYPIFYKQFADFALVWSFTSPVCNCLPLEIH